MLTDLEVADVMLEAPLSGRFDLAVPDLLEAYGERQRHDARQLAKYDFTIIELDGADVEKTMDYLRRYPALTLHDVWALYLCVSRGHRLLTRSSQLTSAAADAGIVTHSTLWLLDQLVVAACLSPWEAVAAVRQMQSRGRGLSQARCDRFIEKWDRPRYAYLALVVYLSAGLGFPKREVYSATTPYAALTDELRNRVPARVFDLIVHTDNRAKVRRLEAWVRAT